MSGPSARKRARRRWVALRIRLFLTEPRCHWCGIETILATPMRGCRHLPDLATLDHLHHRSDPRRHQPGGSRAIVLACYSCNNARGAGDAVMASMADRLRAMHREMCCADAVQAELGFAKTGYLKRDEKRGEHGAGDGLDGSMGRDGDGGVDRDQRRVR